MINGSDVRATPTTEEVEVRGVSGSTEIVYPDFLPPPNVAHASVYSADGHASRTVSVLIERPAGVAPDPPEPPAPVTAPAGLPITCGSPARVVGDVAGDVLTYAPGKPPARVKRLTPAISGIDLTRAAVQIDGRTVCAVFAFARPPMVVTGTLPPASAEQFPSGRFPSAKDVAWSVTTRYETDKYGPYYGDWLPRHEPVGQPFIRQRDGTTVRFGAKR